MSITVKFVKYNTDHAVVSFSNGDVRHTKFDDVIGTAYAAAKTKKPVVYTSTKLYGNGHTYLSTIRFA